MMHKGQRYESYEKELISMRFLPLDYLSELLGRGKNSLSVQRSKLRKFNYTKDEVEQYLDFDDTEVCRLFGISKSTLFYLRKWFKKPEPEFWYKNPEPEPMEIDYQISITSDIANRLFDKAKSLTNQKGHMVDIAEVIEIAIERYLRDA